MTQPAPDSGHNGNGASNGTLATKLRAQQSVPPILAPIEKAGLEAVRTMRSIVESRQPPWRPEGSGTAGLIVVERWNREASDDDDNDNDESLGIESGLEARIGDGDATLPAELIARLASPDRALADLTSLGETLWALEVLHIEEPALRKALADALLTLALRLRDDRRAAATPALWSALRRYATLIDSNASAVLMEFLREDDDASTRQLALQCIQTSLFRELPSRVSTDLVDRVRQLCERYLHPDVLVAPAMRSLAANAAVAFSVLAPEEAQGIAEWVRSLRRPGLRALVASKWTEMVASRDEAAALPLRGALAVLQS